MKLCITSLGKDAFDLDVLETDTLFDLKALIRERLALEGPKKQGLKLVHDTSLLENDIESLSSYGLEDGSSLLLLLENPGPIRLEAHVWDRTPEDSLLTAAESGELQHPVSKIEVTVGTFQDQDWGNCKGNLFLSLLKGDLVLVRQNLYGTYRLDGYPHGRHPPPLTFTESDDLVRLAEDFLELQKQNIATSSMGLSQAFNNLGQAAQAAPLEVDEVRDKSYEWLIRICARNACQGHAKRDSVLQIVEELLIALAIYTVHEVVHSVMIWIRGVRFLLPAGAVYGRKKPLCEYCRAWLFWMLMFLWYIASLFVVLHFLATGTEEDVDHAIMEPCQTFGWFSG
eukprot:g2770.t4